MPRKVRKQKSHVFRNPLNATVGLVLRDGRTELSLGTPEDVAKKLVVSSSTYRLIESGAIAIPTYCAIKIMEVFDLEWTPLIQIVGAQHVLDRHFKSSEAMKEAATRLAEADSALHLVIETLAPAWAAIDAGEDGSVILTVLRERGIVEGLSQFLRTRQTTPPLTAIEDAAEAGRRLVEGTPPLYLEIAESLVSQLRKFAPHVDADALIEWEEENSKRIADVYGVMKEPEHLKDSARFRWSYVVRRSAPARVRVLCRGTEQDVKAAAEVLIETLVKRAEVDEKLLRESISVRAVSDEEWKATFQPLLRFDFRTRSHPVLETYEGEQAKEPLRFRDFNNSWVYTLSPQLAGTRKITGGRNTVAFMDDSSSRPEQRAYAVACSWDHTRALRELLVREWKIRS